MTEGSRRLVAEGVAPGAQPSAMWAVVSFIAVALALASTLADGVGPMGGDPRIYVDAAESLIHGDYRSDSEISGLPRYPPGFPVVLAPFVALWGDDGARWASAAIGGGLVVLVWFTSLRIGGHRAAALAATLWMLSPLVSDYSTDIMSDPLGASVVLLGVLAAMNGRWAITGALLAWSGWTRLANVVFLPGVGRRRAAWLAGLAVLLPLAVFQLAVYGRLAGYDGGQAQFALSNIWDETSLLYIGQPSPWPNWQFFPGLLWGLSSGLVPMLPIFAAVEIFSRWSEPATRLATWVIVVNVVVYLPYFYQAPRFVLPAACLVIVFAACGMIRIIDGIRFRTRCS